MFVYITPNHRCSPLIAVLAKPLSISAMLTSLGSFLARLVDGCQSSRRMSCTLSSAADRTITVAG